MNSYCAADNPKWEYDNVYKCDDYEEDDCLDCYDSGNGCEDDCGCDDGADCYYDD